jgi:hypothetical protein
MAVSPVGDSPRDSGVIGNKKTLPTAGERPRCPKNGNAKRGIWCHNSFLFLQIFDQQALSEKSF